jgi:hypothetical protein
VYYYPDDRLLQYYRVYDADLCRTVGSAVDDESDNAGSGHAEPDGHHDAAEQLAAVDRLHAGERMRRT